MHCMQLSFLGQSKQGPVQFILFLISFLLPPPCYFSSKDFSCVSNLS